MLLKITQCTFLVENLMHVNYGFFTQIFNGFGYVVVYKEYFIKGQHNDRKRVKKI